MYICIYVYIYTYTYVYICMCIYIHTYRYVYIHINIYGTCVFACLYPYIYRPDEFLPICIDGIFCVTDESPPFSCLFAHTQTHTQTHGTTHKLFAFWIRAVFSNIQSCFDTLWRANAREVCMRVCV